MGNFLPQFLQQQVPAVRGQGSTGGYAPVPTQAQSAPPSQGASMAAGIADFLSNFQKGKQAQQDKNKQDFMSDVQLMMLGIPVDHTKMAKKAKAAGMDLDFDGNNAPVMAQQAANAGVAAQQSAGIPQMANDMASDATQQMLVNGISQPVGVPPIPMNRSMPPVDGEYSRQQPLPQPLPGGGGGLLSRIGQGLGLTQGAVNPNSSGMAWLQQLAEQGKKTAAMGTEEQRQGAQMQQVKAGMLDLMQKAVTGDPHALELVSRFPEPYGLKSMPFDGLLALGRQAGQPDTKTAQAVLFHALGSQQALQHMQTLAKDFAPHFGGDLGRAMQYVQESTATGQSRLKPQMSLEQQVKVQDFADRFAAKYPTVPMNVVMTYANLKATGNDAAASTVLDYISNNHKREGQIAGEQFNTTNQYHRDAMNQAMQMHNETIDLAIKKALLDAAGDDGKIAWELINGKDSTDATKVTGYNMLAAAASKKGDITATFRGANGKKKSLTFGEGQVTADRVKNWFSKDSADLSFKMPTANDLSQFTGAPQKGGVMDSIGETIKKGQMLLEKQIEDQLLAGEPVI